MDTEFLIIGAGPTGLGAASRLEENGRDWLLLESTEEFGGLAASFVDEAGFTWDYGGHVQFSHYDTFDRYMDLALGPDGWINHRRESGIWLKGRYVPYPFQNNLHRLDPEDRWQCVEGLYHAWSAQQEGANPIPEHFEAWMLSTFGPGLTDLFMRPYNFKTWAYPPATMDCHWIGERVAVPPLDRVLRSICLNEDAASWGPNATFRFPLRGGTGAVWKAIGRRLPSERVSFGSRVVRIHPGRQEVETEDGAIFGYRHLLSAMPLNHLIGCAKGVVPHQESERLVYSSTHVVGIGLSGCPPEHLRTKCWMYFPQANSPYYRTTVFSNYSHNNVPEPGSQWSLMTETSESPAKPVDSDRLVEETLQALAEDELLTGEVDIVSTVHRRLPQGYPTPFRGRDSIVDPILRRFEAEGVWSRGRFGAWKYEVSNQDHSFAQGYEWVERMMTGGGPDCEPTLFTPAFVNGRRNP